MQILQTPEHLAYQNIHDEIFYNGTPLRNICQHVENCGKPRSLHPTWCNQNQMFELTFDIFHHKLGQNKGDQSWRRKHITYLKSPRIAEGIQTQGPQRQWSFRSEIMLALNRMRWCQQVHLWKAPKAKSHLSHLREKVPLQKQLIPWQIINLHIEVGRNVSWKKSNTVLVGQTQYLAVQPGKKRRHCTTLITKVSLSHTVIQMQGNHLTREVKGHPM